MGFLYSEGVRGAPARAPVKTCRLTNRQQKEIWREEKRGKEKRDKMVGSGRESPIGEMEEDKFRTRQDDKANLGLFVSPLSDRTVNFEIINHHLQFLLTPFIPVYTVVNWELFSLFFSSLSYTMRSTLRLLANVKSAKYLEPFAPTGLTGLHTHPSPRPTLIYLYTSVLQKLRAFPESSVYRQSTEALTRQRLEIVESTKPPGFEAWLERAKKTVAAEPERFATVRRQDGSYAARQQDDSSENPRRLEWEGEGVEPPSEGPARNAAEMAQWSRVVEEGASVKKDESDFHDPHMKWEAEPALEAEQYVAPRLFQGYTEGGLTIGPGSLTLRRRLALVLLRKSFRSLRVNSSLWMRCTDLKRKSELMDSFQLTALNQD